MAYYFLGGFIIFWEGLLFRLLAHLAIRVIVWVVRITDDIATSELRAWCSPHTFATSATCREKIRALASKLVHTSYLYILVQITTYRTVLKSIPGKCFLKEPKYIQDFENISSGHNSISFRIICCCINFICEN